MGESARPFRDPLGNFIHGAPALAPLLFLNISVLAGFGLVDLLQRRPR